MLGRDVILSSPSQSLTEETLEVGGHGRSFSFLFLKAPCKVWSISRPPVMFIQQILQQKSLWFWESQ